MFYEEKIIDGVLMCRSMPNGKWEPLTTPHAKAVNLLMKLLPEDRAKAFRFFCHHCGKAEPECQCWNDD